MADRARPPLCEDGKVGDGYGVTGDGEVRLAGPGRLEAGYACGNGWRAAVEQDQRGDVHGQGAISTRRVLASSELSRSSRHGCRLARHLINVSRARPRGRARTSPRAIPGIPAAATGSPVGSRSQRETKEPLCLLEHRLYPE